MTSIREISSYLEEFAPHRLAEEWDNVGHLVGDASLPVTKLMTCLTVTPVSVREAIEREAQLIVSHHPFPFRPLKRVTTSTTTGRLLMDLIAAGISVYSPHTAFDSAALGINQQLAAGLGLEQIQPLVPLAGDPAHLGAGRWGRLLHDATLVQFADRLKEFLAVETLQMVGAPSRSISTVAVACGSAGSFLEDAHRCHCDLLVTGETSFHTCLEAEALQMGLLLPGHYASERFAVEQLADRLAETFPQIQVWASRRERDPLREI